MKNLQQGFIFSALIIVIAVLLIGGGGYVYLSRDTSVVPDNKQDLQENISDQTESSSSYELNSNGSTVADSKEKSVTPQIETKPEPVKVIAEPVASKTYKHSKFGFSLNYSSNLKVEEGFTKPNTYYVTWKNQGGQVTNVIYINEGSLPLTSSEKATGVSTVVGKKAALKFITGKGTIYLVENPSYTLSIYYPAAVTASDAISINTFTF